MNYALCLLGIFSAVSALSDLDKQIQIQIDSLQEKVAELSRKYEEHAEVQSSMWQYMKRMETHLEIEQPGICKKWLGNNYTIDINNW